MRKWIMVLAAVSAAASLNAREVNEIVNDLAHEDFNKREAAMKELAAKKLTENQLAAMIAAEKHPERKVRLMHVWNLTLQFVPFTVGHQFPKNIRVEGREANRTMLYLIRTVYKGETYLGKYSPSHKCGYIPVGGREVVVRSGMSVYAGTRKWVKRREVKSPLKLGKTKDGRQLYAARARLEGGIHIGMWVEGEKFALIPYGGVAKKMKDFEVLHE